MRERKFWKWFDIIISNIFTSIYTICLIPSFFYYDLSLICLALIIPIGLLFFCVRNSIILNKLIEEKRRIKIIIYNILILLSLLLIYVLTLSNALFDIVIYLVNPICYSTFVISYFLSYIIVRRKKVLNNELLPLYEMYKFNLKIGLLLVNCVLVITCIYVRFTQVVFAFGRFDKNFSDIIKIIVFILLIISIIIGFIYLCFSLWARYHDMIKTLVLSIVGIILNEFIVIFICTITCLLGSFCFYPSGYDESYIDGYNDVSQVEIVSGNNKFTGLYVNNGKEELTIMFPGNGMSAYYTVFPLYPHLKNSNTNLLVVDYPYFGGSKARLSEENLFLEAELFYEYGTNELNYPSDKIIIAGYSIGTGMASYLASKHDCKKVVLGAPYNNFTSVINSYVNIFYPPLTLFIEYKFASDVYAKDIKAPVSIVCVSDDVIVKKELSYKLKDAFGKEVEIIELESGGHGSVVTSIEYVRRIFDLNDDYVLDE